MTADPLQPLMDALRSAWPQADNTSLVTAADQLLRGQSATLGTSTASLTFGQGNDFRDATISIGPIAGGNITQITINFPQPINPQAASLQQLLYHHESATIFANRLESFVGREAEIAEIRQRIAQVIPMGGYVTITAQAGEGKSSVIAQMVSQDGPDQTAFHFIALTPGRDYQLSLLRPIVARLLLKYQLPATYFPDTSYPSMRDYFHSLLRQLSERGIQEVIYLDGLDQLDPEPGGLRDLSFLPSRPPPGIAFVLGTRPDDTLQPLEVKQLKAEYRLPQLSMADFRLLLSKQGVVTAEGKRMYTALQGNAFYLGLVVQELKAGPIADLDAFVRRISDNPDNLFGLTIDRLRRQDHTLWKGAMLPILALLLAAQESLGIALMRSMLDIEDIDLRTGLQRMGGLVAQDSRGQFFLYHLKVRDYLQEDPAQPDKPYVVRQDQIVDWHAKLAEWCIQNTTDIQKIWENTIGLEQMRRWYARHHYVTHLMLGKQWKTLRQVIDDGTYGQYKRRFDPSTQLYTFDLDHARAMALHRNDLSALWRWSLLRVSLTSQVDVWPDILFDVLVHLGRIGETLNCIELVINAVRKVRLFCRIVPLLDARDAHQVWERTHTIATSIEDVMDRTSALCTLAVAQMHANHPGAATTFTLARVSIANMRDDVLRTRALWVLAEAQLKTQQWQEAQITVGLITNSDQRAKICRMVATAQARAGLWKEARATSNSIEDIEQRSEALCAIAIAQAQAELWKEAQVTIAAISERWPYTAALHGLVLAQAKAGLWKDADTIIKAVIDEDQRAEVLCALAEGQAAVGLWQDCLMTITAIHSEWQQSQARHSLAVAQAKAGLWQEAQITIASISDSWPRNNALHAVVVALAQTGLYAEAQRSAAAISVSMDRAIALSELAVIQAQAHHPDAQNTFALARVHAATASNDTGLSIEPLDDARTAALYTLAEVQIRAQLWGDALATITRIPSAWAMAKALCELGQAQACANNQAAAHTFERARTEIAHIPYDWNRTSALHELALAQARAGFWQDSVITIGAIPDSRPRSLALRDLVAAQTNAGLWKEAKTTITSIPDAEQRTAALRDLAIALTNAGLWKHADSIITTIPDQRAQTGALKALAESQIQHGKWKSASSTLARLASAKERTELFCTLALAQFQVSDPEAFKTFDLAQTTAESIRSDEERAEAFCRLAVAQTQTNHPGARASFDHARTSANTILHPIKAKATILCTIAAAQADVNASEAYQTWAMARNHAANILNAIDRATTLCTVAIAQAHAHDKEVHTTLSMAITSAKAIADPLSQAHTFCKIAAAQVLVNPSEAVKTFIAARTSAETISDLETRISMLRILAQAQVDAGLWQQARITMTTIAPRDERIFTLKTIARAQAQAGLWNEARRSASYIPDQEQRASTLRDLTLDLIKAGMWDDAQDIAESIDHDIHQAAVLHTVYTAMVQAGAINRVCQGVALVWYRADTLDTLLRMVRIALPILTGDSSLARKFVAGLLWVDEEIRDG